MNAYILNFTSFLTSAQPSVDQLDLLERALGLVDKYGVTVTLMIVFGVIIYGFLRAMRTGELVPKEQLTKVEQERDEAQKQVQDLIAIMNGEREKFMSPLLAMLSNLKKDSEDRGG